jgi:hypothetical protein
LAVCHPARSGITQRPGASVSRSPPDPGSTSAADADRSRPAGARHLEFVHEPGRAPAAAILAWCELRERHPHHVPDGVRLLITTTPRASLLPFYHASRVVFTLIEVARRRRAGPSGWRTPPPRAQHATRAAALWPRYSSRRHSPPIRGAAGNLALSLSGPAGHAILRGVVAATMWRSGCQRDQDQAGGASLRGHLARYAGLDAKRPSRDRTELQVSGRCSRARAGTFFAGSRTGRRGTCCHRRRRRRGHIRPWRPGS